MYHCTCITYMTLPIYTIYIVLHTIPPMSIPNRHCYTKCYYIVTYCNVLWRTYSVYTFCDHKYVPMWSQICIYLMWLTLSFSWSVCFCVYTYHPTPSGACRPLSTQAWSRIMQRHDPCWKRYDTIHPPPYQRYVCFQQVTCLRQLLLHQLPLLVVIK